MQVRARAAFAVIFAGLLASSCAPNPASINTAFVLLDVEADVAEAYAIARQAVDSLAVTAIREDGAGVIEARDARARHNTLSITLVPGSDGLSRVVATLRYRLDDRFSHLPLSFYTRAGQIARERDIPLSIVPQAGEPEDVESCSVESPRGPEGLVFPELIGGISGLHARIRYPEAARRSGIQGTVMVQLVVDLDGTIPCAIVLSGLPGGLNEAALKAVIESRFTPARYKGEPVAMNLMLPVRFRIR